MSKVDPDSDIPAHTYQLTFDPNKEWTQFYASAKEIHRYWKNIAEKYNCMQYIKLGRRVLESRWELSQSKWIVKASFLRMMTSLSSENSNKVNLD